jgi:hypothetical protein
LAFAAVVVSDRDFREGVKYMKITIVNAVLKSASVTKAQ